MNTRTTTSSPWSLGTLVSGWLGAMLLASAVSAQDGQVYFTYSAVDTGPASGWTIGVHQSGGVVPLHLWVQGGGVASTGSPCQLGATGNEICAVNVVLHGNGHFEFTDFDPNPSFDSGPSAVPILANVTQQRLNLNALDFGTPGLGNRYLGVVAVLPIGNPTPEDTMTVTGGVMRANMEMWNVMPRDVLLPEPGFAGALAVGALGLASVRRAGAGRRR